MEMQVPRYFVKLWVGEGESQREVWEALTATEDIPAVAEAYGKAGKWCGAVRQLVKFGSAEVVLPYSSRQSSQA